MRIEAKKIGFYFTILSIFQLIFLSYINIGVLGYIWEIISILFLLSHLIYHFPNVIKEKMDNFSLLLFCYSICLLISAYIGLQNNFSINPLYSSLVYLTEIWLIYLNLKLVLNYFSLKEIVIVLFYLVLFFCILNDLILLINHSNVNDTYFLGNKFGVSFLHLDAVVFYLLINPKVDKSNKLDKKIILLGIYALGISAYVECTTVSIGIILFFIMYYLFPMKLMKNGLTWLITLILSSTFYVSYFYLLNFGWFQNFIVNILHKDISLTGRRVIYQNLPLALKGHWIWGYGFNSDFQIWNVILKLNFPDCQNGLINIILEQGMICAAIIIIIFLLSLNKIKLQNLKSIVCLVYVYTLISSVEVTFGLQFLFLGMLMYLGSVKGRERTNFA